MLPFSNEILDKHISAFRAGVGCQHVLLRLVEDWKKALDRNEFVGVLLTDLSKAFDCMSHSLLVAKLRAYGMSAEATELLADYLSHRKQRVKLSGENTLSSWLSIQNGVPQGSVLGPMLFNIFINDIFNFVDNGSLHNYADDNSSVTTGKNVGEVINALTTESNKLIKWFTENKMEANPDKFQCMILPGHRKEVKNSDLCIPIGNQGTTVNNTSCVKLLGVFLDNNLCFKDHVNFLCKTTTRQLNTLSRLAKYIDEKGRLAIYKSFVMSNFNYCPLVWHFCGKLLCDKLEKLNYRALKITFNDYRSSYRDLLIRANLPSLELNRIRQLACEVYKAIHGLSPLYVQDMFKLKKTKYNFRGKYTITIPAVKKNYSGINSFRYKGAQVWNCLPVHFKESTDFNVFKNMMKTWTGENCRCISCKF